MERYVQAEDESGDTERRTSLARKKNRSGEKEEIRTEGLWKGQASKYKERK